ncbi:ABC transporter ATP-binding protein (plasmid) [Skermanella sp. TT6]|uniref:ABC transporter ATP-binding protein n=1 Tax=Skermanella cutis TaxID=2775420 RepID=A0ABX7BEH6_9PROT|nr:ABC transporter ATP-binding protein [Skermanella sp. TT6]QQP92814.1 ABC transporter ATP-binding protein [Skermanella sp. TT6]
MAVTSSVPDPVPPPSPTEAPRGRPRIALSIRDLTKRYGSVAAIDRLSLDIASGEFLSLLGPSGSGKSTILMAIAGFVDPDGGDILLDGQPVGGLPPEKRGFGVVFQGYALFPHMTVRGNIAYPLKLRGIRGAELDRRVERAIDLVHLQAFAERMPRQLSGGQQQRVALARALVFDPAVVLLDEPLSALDKKLRAELQFELKSLHQRLGTTFVNVTHDQEEAMTMSDRIVILRDGRVQQTGTPDALYNTPATRFVADFLGRANFLEGQAGPVSGGCLTIDIGGASLRHRLRDGEPRMARTALLALRPERLSVLAPDTAAGDLNRVEGRVVTSAFVGSQHIHVVETPLGVLEAHTPAFGAGVLRKPGEAVALAWPWDGGVLVEDR